MEHKSDAVPAFWERSLPIFFLLAAALASVALQGFDYAPEGNVYHIPVIFDYAHSAEGPADVYHQSLDRFVSGFYPILSLFATESNIFSVSLAIHVLSRFFTILMIWKIVSLLINNQNISVMLSSFLVYSFNSANFFSHSEFAEPILLLGWYFLLKRQYLVSSAVLGVAFNINAYIAVWGGVVAGVCMLSSLKNEGLKAAIKMGWIMAGLFVLLASPTVLWILKSTAMAATYEPFSFREYLREYWPFHWFIDVQWKEVVFVWLSIMTAFTALSHIKMNWPLDKRAPVFSIITAIAGIFVFGMILPYVTDNRFLLNLVPLEDRRYVPLLMGIIIVTWCASAFQKNAPDEKALSLIALSGVLSGNIILVLITILLFKEFSSNSFWKKSAPLLLLGAMGAAHAVFGAAPTGIEVWGKTAALILIFQSTLIACILPKSGGYFTRALPLIAAAALGVLPSTQDNLFLALIFFVYLALALYFAARNYKPIIIAAIIVSLLVVASAKLIWLGVIAAAFLLPTPASRLVPYLKKFAPAAYPSGAAILALLAVCLLSAGAVQLSIRGGLSSNPQADRALKDTQFWARSNTPPHTVFLPVGVDGFSTLSRRPVWIDWKIGAMAMWAPETYEMWSTRWRQLKPVDTVAKAQNLARKEGVSFIVFKKDKVASDGVAKSCIAYENELFWIMGPC